MCLQQPGKTVNKSMSFISSLFKQYEEKSLIISFNEYKNLEIKTKFFMIKKFAELLTSNYVLILNKLKSKEFSNI